MLKFHHRILRLLIKCHSLVGRGVDDSALHTDSLLPVELWLNLFSYLDMPDFKAISLVCKALRTLTLPIVFRHLELSLDGPRFSSLSPDKPLVQWRRQRLRFFASKRIRSLVRQCTIVGFRWSFTRKSGYSALFTKKCLGRFCNLDELDFTNVYLGDRQMEALQCITAQPSLSLHNCTVFLGFGDPSPSRFHMKIRHISITQTLANHSGVDSALDVFLDVDCLETLEFHREVLPKWLPSQTLPHLRVLRIIECSLPHPYKILPMPVFPFLETLTYLPGENPSYESLVFSPAPKLKHFEGPIRVLSSLLRGGAIESLSLPYPHETRDMPEVLREVAKFNIKLRTLKVALAYLDCGLLEATCAFPALRELEIDVGNVCPGVEHRRDIILTTEAFVSTFLSLTLPLCLERITVRISKHSFGKDFSCCVAAASLKSWALQHNTLRARIHPCVR